MRHIFRLNIAGCGYSLISGETLSGCKKCQLDVSSENIPRDFLSVQQRIDSILASRIPQWTVGSSHSPGRPPVVGYGCFLAAKDDKERTGISFIHGIESEDPIDHILTIITSLLGSSKVNKLTGLIAAIASGTANENELLEILMDSKIWKTKSPSNIRGKNEVISQIKHDCGGASALAWMAIFKSHRKLREPWEIYEIRDRDSLDVSTMSTLAGREWNLSELLDSLTENLYFDEAPSHPGSQRTFGKETAPSDQRNQPFREVTASSSPGNRETLPQTTFTNSKQASGDPQRRVEENTPSTPSDSSFKETNGDFQNTPVSSSHQPTTRTPLGNHSSKVNRPRDSGGNHPEERKGCALGALLNSLSYKRTYVKLQETADNTLKLVGSHNVDQTELSDRKFLILETEDHFRFEEKKRKRSIFRPAALLILNKKGLTEKQITQIKQTAKRTSTSSRPNM